MADAKPKLPTSKPTTPFPSALKQSTPPGATKATQQYTTRPGPTAPTKATTTNAPFYGLTPKTVTPKIENPKVIIPKVEKTTELTADQKRILELEKQLAAGSAVDPAFQYQKDLQAADRKSAFEVLADEFKANGLESLGAEVERFMKEGVSPAEARVALRQTQAYKDRFKGNEGRLKKGLAVYQPTEYFQAEETYRNLLIANNLQDLVSKNTTDSFISGAVSAQEVQDRIQNVFTKIDNADPTLKGQLGQYFSNYGIADPNLQRSQLASALLTGETSSMALERQLKKAQLRAGAQMSGVTIAETGVESLQKQLEAQNVSDVYGVAKTGFGTLSQTMPTTEKLANIYGDQATGLSEELQQEAFFGLQSQRRKKLQEREQATFGGRAGVSTAGLGKGTAGSF